MKGNLLAAVSGATVVVAGLAGCGGEDKPEAAQATETTAQAPAPGDATVLIQGVEQDIPGPVECEPVFGTVGIQIGGPDSGIGATLTEGENPEVQWVMVGNVDGVQLGHWPTVTPPGSSAEVAKDGDTYTVTGTATGAPEDNPQQVVSKPFEMTLTCP
ncbi:hypothetical protein AU193_15925 [Mycobacterium sp. GA-1285]|uniref:lipoprotein LpqH n=1 Tax=Mycobacterium sp. GA-1285 TaxID=1772282 RepID=UPI000746CAB0|nr:lipoprotein LpqH [Mycobacterium sp. GA-1285]KUI16252.1 hypothetical protein AU193_15925 [Mycobacterium sp. GA-1285]